MAFVRMVSDEEATGQVKEDLDFIGYSYSNALWNNEFYMPAQDIYRASSIVPPWLHLIAEMNGLLTENGAHYCFSDGTVPRLAVGFAVARFNGCFH